jgi:CubicO group peptidase (beta-lactamase class C family)
MVYGKRPAALAAVMILTAALWSGCTSASTERPTPASAAPQLHPDVQSRLDAAMVPLTAHEEFSGTLLIAHAGTTVATRSYGWSDTANRAPNRIDTRFRIGSITKQFTAMAILLLQEQGKLRVDHPVCRYLTSCPQQWRPITLHHLLTHTSGVPYDVNQPNQKPHNRAITPANLVAEIANWPLDFPTGSRYSYSNSGYNILGHVIEQVSHHRYADFLRVNILDPLALHNTGYDSRPVAPQHAIGHLATGVPADIVDASVAFANSGMYSTVEDLARWTQTLSDRRFASRASIDAMLSPQVSWCDDEGTLCPSGKCAPRTLGGFDRSSCASYGYGWDLYDQQNPAGGADKVIEHSGRISGFRALSLYYPDRQLYLVVLTNSLALDPYYVLRLARNATTID